MIRTFNTPAIAVRSEPVARKFEAAAVIELGATFLGVAFAVSLVAGLVGSVARETASMDSAAIEGRARAATETVEALRMEVEQLKLPASIEAWARLNGFTHDGMNPVAKVKDAAPVLGVHSSSTKGVSLSIR